MTDKELAVQIVLKIIEANSMAQSAKPTPQIKFANIQKMLTATYQTLQNLDK